jgi:hypothetical protein
VHFDHGLKIYYCKMCVFKCKGLAGENNVTASRKTEGKKARFEGDTSLAS